MAYTSGRLYTDQVTGIGTNATQLHPTQVCREVMIQSDPTNTTNMLIGTFANQFIVLTPGQAVTLPIFSLALVWVKMASLTGKANWLARD